MDNTHENRLTKRNSKSSDSLQKKEKRNVSEMDCSKGLSIIISTFKDLQINKATMHVYYTLLSDLSKEDFERGVMGLCKKYEKLYPGDNIVALIRKYAKDEKPINFSRFIKKPEPRLELKRKRDY